MAATLLSTPPTPASVYRPLEYRMQAQGFAGGSQVAEIRVATATDVSTLGNGLVEGDILVQHALLQAGSLDPQPGDPYYFQGCSGYSGIWRVDKSILQGAGTNYMTIVAPNLGTMVPPVFGLLRRWATGYTFYLRLSIYSATDAAPSQVILRATPSITTGIVSFDVAPALRDYFSTDISTFMGAVAGYVQTANGTTANFYKSEIVEIWNDPDELDVQEPFDGSHDVYSDDDFLVGVNAVHPYSAPVTNWSTQDLTPFVIGNDAADSRFLTMMTRGTTVKHDMGIADRFRIHMLTDTDFAVGFVMRVSQYYTATPTVTDEAITMSGDHAAFSLACGPADLSPYMVIASRYTVQLLDDEDNPLSEILEVIVDRKCSENTRPFAWLGKLGAVERYTFTGREIGQSKVKRATLMKPMSRGTGYDWAERTYRAEVERVRTVSTKAIKDPTRRWLAEDMGESATVVVVVNDMTCPAIIIGRDLQSFNTANNTKPLTVEYMAGVDNLSQQG